VKAFDRLIDTYFSHPILFDIVLAAIIWISSNYCSIIEFKLTNRTNQINILPYIISTDVSLAGFILAALTIIVTFKSNLRAKGIEDSENALEMIFSSKHYESIIKVFKKSLIEFVMCFIILFFVWVSSDNLTIQIINRIVISGVFLTSLAIIRSLYILFVVLDLDKHKRAKEK